MARLRARKAPGADSIWASETSSQRVLAKEARGGDTHRAADLLRAPGQLISQALAAVVKPLAVRGR